MSERKHIVIATDIGTTSTKTLAVDAQAGTVLASHSVAYPLLTPHIGYAEQDPEAIYEAVLTTIATVMQNGQYEANQVKCVTFSSANHSLIALDQQGELITNSITWADQRSTAQVEQLKQNGEAIPIYLRTGTPIHPMSPLLKLLWLKQNEPLRFEQAAMFIGIKDYVFYKLFGIFITDYSMASATGLFNLEKLDYDAKALELAGIREDQLPKLVPSTHIVTGLNRTLASQLGLAPTTKFVLGAQDGVLANLGIGAVEQGVVAVTIGTSSAVRTRVNKPTFDKEGRLFCYALTDDYWMVGGASNNGAIIAQWTADRLYPGEALGNILPTLDEIPPGSNGLLFLPLLAGERAPFWDSKAKGLLFGLTLSHTNEQIMHAALEGVLFQVAGVVSLLQEAGIAVKEVRASGGFARSSLWCQMMADLLGVPILIPNDVESSSLGAVQLGLYAIEGGPLNRWSQIEGETYTPHPDKHHVYNKLLPFYTNLYQTLKTQMSELDDLI